ncbi:hypothetical protein CFP75_41360 [Amycolatopsis alba DSM 44262]|uniref:Uncharacterized protein n=1 Tax=Amycolatopsis alba DSM 44262 TaxID=1125972 RepID=A0A229R800_AMYAL|nr:hypothetical protein CFP75_41360 [Amycolatopsis alba DSM 44262]
MEHVRGELTDPFGLVLSELPREPGGSECVLSAVVRLVEPDTLDLQRLVSERFSSRCAGCKWRSMQIHVGRPRSCDHWPTMITAVARRPRSTKVHSQREHTQTSSTLTTIEAILFDRTPNLLITSNHLFVDGLFPAHD